MYCICKYATKCQFGYVVVVYSVFMSLFFFASLNTLILIWILSLQPGIAIYIYIYHKIFQYILLTDIKHQNPFIHFIICQDFGVCPCWDNGMVDVGACDDTSTPSSNRQVQCQCVSHSGKCGT